MASWQEDIKKDAGQFKQQAADLTNKSGQIGDKAGAESDYFQQRATEFYNNLVQGQGYTPEEAQKIMQSEQFQSLLYSQDDQDKAFLTGDEQNEVRGNPYASKNAYNSDSLFGAVGAGNNNQRGNWVTNSGSVDRATGRLQQGLDGAIDPSAQLDPNYKTSGEAYINDGEGDRIGALNQGFHTAQTLGKDIRLSDKYQQAVNVGDDEVQGIQDEAARQIRAGNARTIQDAQMRALQGGNANGLAVGAFQDKLQNEGQAEEADAAASARMKALNYQRGWADTEEGRRLGAAEASTGIKSQGLQFLRDQSGVYGDTMHAGLGLNDSAESKRESQLNTLMAARTRAAAVGGAAGIDAANSNRAGSANIESQVAERDINANRDDMNARVGLETAGENGAQNRAAQLILNRQGTQQQNVQNKFNQGQAVYGQQSNASGRVADTRRQDQQTGGSYFANQGQFDSNKQDKAADRQVDIYGRATGAVNTANNTYTNARAQPGVWGKIAGAVLGAAGIAGSVYTGRPPARANQSGD